MHDLEVGQRLRQRLADAAEHRVDLISGRRRLRQSASQLLVLLRQSAHRGCSGCAPSVRSRRPSRPGCPGSVPELSMMSLTWSMLVLKSPTIACVESTSRCSAGPSPPTASAVSSSSDDLLLAAAPQDRGWRCPAPARSHWAPCPSVIVCPGEKYPPALALRHQVQVLLADCRHRMHVRHRVERDLEVAGDAHRRLGAFFGRLDGGHLADRDAAIGHVGRRVQAAGGRQFGLQLVLADAHQRSAAAGSRCPAPQGHDVRMPKMTSWSLMKRVSIAGPPSPPVVRPARRSGSA